MYRLHYAPDNASLVVRIALEEIGAPYETTFVDRRLGGPNSPAYLKLNPRGLIPVMETPDGAIFETAAIVLWLADRHGMLAPKVDDPARGRFLAWLFALSNGLHADLRLLFYPERYSASDRKGHAALTIARIRDHLDRLEALAEQKTGWFAGKDPTVLDIYLTVMLRWLALYPEGQTGWFDLMDWPELKAMARRLEKRASVKAAAGAEGLGSSPFLAPRLPDPY